MKTNASTSTDFDIENHQIKKRLSLQPLFMPNFRFKLLLEKTILLHSKPNNNNETLNNFSNKSIFILRCKKPKYLESSDKKYNSTKHLFSNKFKLKKINQNGFNKHISMNNTFNKKSANKFRNLTIKSINDLAKDSSKTQKFPKTAKKKVIPLFSFKKINNNFFDIKRRLNYKMKNKTIEKNKTNSKLTNIIINKNNSFFIINRKEKKYKLKAKKL